MTHGRSGRMALAFLFSALLTFCGGSPLRAVPLPSGGSAGSGPGERSCSCAPSRPGEIRLCIWPVASGELQPVREDDSRRGCGLSACPAMRAEAAPHTVRLAAAYLPSSGRRAGVLHKYMRMTVRRQSLF